MPGTHAADRTPNAPSDAPAELRRHSIVLAANCRPTVAGATLSARMNDATRVELPGAAEAASVGRVELGLDRNPEGPAAVLLLGRSDMRHLLTLTRARTHTHTHTNARRMRGAQRQTTCNFNNNDSR